MFLSKHMQARELAKKRKEKEMRGGGEGEANKQDKAEEGGEEEKDFQEDEPIEIDAEPSPKVAPAMGLRKKTSVESATG